MPRKLKFTKRKGTNKNPKQKATPSLDVSVESVSEGPNVFSKDCSILERLAATDTAGN